MARVLISDANRRHFRWEMAPNSYVWQRFSRIERVTGIEPALSAWELFELMGLVLGSLRVSRPRAAWSVPWMPAVMARSRNVRIAWPDESPRSRRSLGRF